MCPELQDTFTECNWNTWCNNIPHNCFSRFSRRSAHLTSSSTLSTAYLQSHITDGMSVVKRLCLLSPQISEKHSNAIESSRSCILLEDIDSVPKKKDHSPVNPFKRVGRNLSHLKTANHQTTKHSITQAHFLHVSLFYWHSMPVLLSYFSTAY